MLPKVKNGVVQSSESARRQIVRCAAVGMVLGSAAAVFAFPEVSWIYTVHMGLLIGLLAAAAFCLIRAREAFLLALGDARAIAVVVVVALAAVVHLVTDAIPNVFVQTVEIRRLRGLTPNMIASIEVKEEANPRREVHVANEVQQFAWSLQEARLHPLSHPTFFRRFKITIVTTDGSRLSYLGGVTADQPEDLQLEFLSFGSYENITVPGAAKIIVK